MPSRRAEGLSRSLTFRLRALEQSVRSIRSQRTAGRTGVRAALDIIGRYPRWIEQFVERSKARIKDDATMVQLLGLVAEDVVAKANFVEEWFAEGSSLNIPLALSE